MLEDIFSEFGMVAAFYSFFFDFVINGDWEFFMQRILLNSERLTLNNGFETIVFARKNHVRNLDDQVGEIFIIELIYLRSIVFEHGQMSDRFWISEFLNESQKLARTFYCFEGFRKPVDFFMTILFIHLFTLKWNIISRVWNLLFSLLFIKTFPWNSNNHSHTLRRR